jgi:DNA polymerase III sliding clamp (beta) subunit (PCNA family)
MERKALLEKLNLVSAALSKNPLIPVLTHLWFTGEQLMAFNDQIAISTPCKTDFVGATPGNILLDLLEASTARNVELSVADGQLLVKADGSRFELDMLPPEDFVFEMPQPQSKETLPVDGEEFLAGMESCMRSVSMGTSVAEQMGITLQIEGDQLALYGTDRTTISCSFLVLERDVPFTRVILRAEFCQQLLKLADPASLQIEVYGDHALFSGKDVIMFGRVVETDRPLDFNEILNRHYPAGTESQLVKIPGKLKLILERACIITDSKVEEAYTTITVRDKVQQNGGTVRVMRFVSKSDLGEVKDAVLVPDHPEVKTEVDPKLMKAALGGGFTHMLVTESAVVMAERNKLRLVTSVSSTVPSRY